MKDLIQTIITDTILTDVECLKVFSGYDTLIVYLSSAYGFVSLSHVFM